MKCSVAFLVLSISVASHAQRRLFVPDPSNPQHVQECRGRIIHETVNGNNYFYSWKHQPIRDLHLDWLDARNVCRRHCMDLVSMETDKENDFIRSLLQKDRLDYIWTSGRRCDFKGCDRPDLQPIDVNGWFWAGSNNKIFPTTERKPNTWSHTGGDGRQQPDNREPRDRSGFGEHESCIAILNNFYNDGIVWHDVACSHKKPFVCEDSKQLLDFVASRTGGNAG